MVVQAVYDFTEAVDGRNSQMQWSLSPDVIKRQVVPVFRRCYERQVTARQALEIAIDYVSATVSNNMSILGKLFEILKNQLSQICDVERIPTVSVLYELFLGLNEELAWPTKPEILEQEFFPLFTRVAEGRIVPEQAVLLFTDSIGEKRNVLLNVIRTLVGNLTAEITEYSTEPAGEKANNGED